MPDFSFPSFPSKEGSPRLSGDSQGIPSLPDLVSPPASPESEHGPVDPPIGLPHRGSLPHSDDSLIIPGHPVADRIERTLEERRAALGRFSSAPPISLPHSPEILLPEKPPHPPLILSAEGLKDAVGKGPAIRVEDAISPSTLLKLFTAPIRFFQDVAKQSTLFLPDSFWDSFDRLAGQIERNRRVEDLMLSGNMAKAHQEIEGLSPEARVSWISWLWNHPVPDIRNQALSLWSADAVEHNTVGSVLPRTFFSPSDLFLLSQHVRETESDPTLPDAFLRSSFAYLKRFWEDTTHGSSYRAESLLGSSWWNNQFQRLTDICDVLLYRHNALSFPESETVELLTETLGDIFSSLGTRLPFPPVAWDFFSRFSISSSRTSETLLALMDTAGALRHPLALSLLTNLPPDSPFVAEQQARIQTLQELCSGTPLEAMNRIDAIRRCAGSIITVYPEGKECEKAGMDMEYIPTILGVPVPEGFESGTDDRISSKIPELRRKTTLEDLRFGRPFQRGLFSLWRYFHVSHAACASVHIHTDQFAHPRDSYPDRWLSAWLFGDSFHETMGGFEISDNRLGPTHEIRTALLGYAHFSPSNKETVPPGFPQAHSFHPLIDFALSLRDSRHRINHPHLFDLSPTKDPLLSRFFTILSSVTDTLSRAAGAVLMDSPLGFRVNIPNDSSRSEEIGRYVPPYWYMRFPPDQVWYQFQAIQQSQNPAGTRPDAEYQIRILASVAHLFSSPEKLAIIDHIISLSGWDPSLLEHEKLVSLLPFLTLSFSDTRAVLSDIYSSVRGLGKETAETDVFLTALRSLGSYPFPDDQMQQLIGDIAYGALYLKEKFFSVYGSSLDHLVSRGADGDTIQKLTLSALLTSGQNELSLSHILRMYAGHFARLAHPDVERILDLDLPLFATWWKQTGEKHQNFPLTSLLRSLGTLPFDTHHGPRLRAFLTSLLTNASSEKWSDATLSLICDALPSLSFFGPSLRAFLTDITTYVSSDSSMHTRSLRTLLFRIPFLSLPSEEKLILAQRLFSHLASFCEQHPAYVHLYAKSLVEIFSSDDSSIETVLGVLENFKRIRAQFSDDEEATPHCLFLLYLLSPFTEVSLGDYARQRIEPFLTETLDELFPLLADDLQDSLLFSDYPLLVNLPLSDQKKFELVAAYADAVPATLLLNDVSVLASLQSFASCPESIRHAVVGIIERTLVQVMQDSPHFLYSLPYDTLEHFLSLSCLFPLSPDIRRDFFSRVLERIESDKGIPIGPALFSLCALVSTQNIPDAEKAFLLERISNLLTSSVITFPVNPTLSPIASIFSAISALRVSPDEKNRLYSHVISKFTSLEVGEIISTLETVIRGRGLPWMKL